ncbi:hypothetical protein DL765_006558 [Monosporascus sp. GIB2]|nr:hypothetical protein DL765_006558 [Monosporascus sp. GIB2]
MSRDTGWVSSGESFPTSTEGGPPNARASDTPLSGTKRRRTALACSACRTRKTRCNGSRPKCELCERMGFECIYEVSDSSANLIVRKDVFGNLETRLSLLEEAVRRHDDQLASNDGDSYRGSTSTWIWGSGVSEKALEATPPPGTVVVRVQDPTDQDQPASESTGTDGMGIYFVDEQDCGFFGPSSNISFMRTIFRALASRGGIPDPPMPSADGSIMNIHRPEAQATDSAQGPTHSLHDSHSFLPPDHLTERLLREYFTNTGLLFPYIHEQSFIETYKQLKQNGFRSNVRRTWLALLNMMLAMATCATASRADPGCAFADSDVFYKRASELCKTQMLRGTTLETVQYLLLTSQYLQGTQQAVQTWTTHGLAVKAALSIGLHSRDASSKFPPIEQEMRKRTWFGCIVLDRSLSMTLGRPSAIPEDYVRLELPKAVIGDRENGMGVSFYTETVNLYKVMWKILANLFGHNLGYKDLSETGLITQIFQLEQELNEWQLSLPEFLQLRTSLTLPEETPPNLNIEQFRIILTLRYLHTQLLLHRPALSRLLQTCFADNGSKEPKAFNTQMYKNFYRPCVRAAEEIISITHKVITQKPLGKHLLGAWWFTLYYIFSAALTVFGSLLVPTEDFLGMGMASDDYRTRGRQTLGKAIHTLVELDNDNPLLNRCIDYLRQLCWHIEDWALTSSLSTPLDVGSSIMRDMPAMVDVGRAGDSASGVTSGFPFQDDHTLLEDEAGLGLLFNNDVRL